jgi:hypothetical protein
MGMLKCVEYSRRGETRPFFLNMRFFLSFLRVLIVMLRVISLLFYGQTLGWSIFLCPHYENVIYFCYACHENDGDVALII